MSRVKKTEYEIDGVLYEAVVSESWTIDVINRWDKASMAMIGELNKMTRHAVENARKDAPLGLADVSILTRWNKEQMAYAAAIEEYVLAKYPKIANRLYRDNEPLWNFCMNCSVCSMDQFADSIEEGN